MNLVNAVIAVMGGALVTWLVTAWREKSGSALTYGQALSLTLMKFAVGARYRGFRESAELVGPVIYLAAEQSRLDRRLLKAFLPVGVFHIRLEGDTSLYLPLVRSVLAGQGRLCLYAPKEVELSDDAMARLAEIGEAARQATARIVPIHISGVRHSIMSFWTREKAPRKVWPQISVVAAPPFACSDAPAAALADQLADGLAAAKLRAADLDRTLFQAIVEAAKLYGPAREILEDSLGGRLTYRQALIGVRVLSRRFADLAPRGKPIGVMLPNSNGAVLTVLALASAGAPAAMLNYTAGPASVASAASTAAVSVVLTSRAFIERAELEKLVERLAENGVRLVYLEDVQKAIGWWDKVLGVALWRWPARRSEPMDAAIVLFTSGSEGAPKGVALSSINLLSNAAQADCRIDISQEDTLFNVLPLFHSFGLLGGMLLPLAYGVRLALYPSPLHYKIIPGVARKVRPTIMFGTDTFLAGYGRAAREGDFESLRMIVAGAEPVRPETRRIFLDRFGVCILEGYGMTEASPVVAVNSTRFSKDGSVGRLLPGMEMALEPVEGMEDGKRLLIAGPNVMMGYYLPDAPGVLSPLSGKWHDTGDIVEIDARGFITIRGRARRFAKIAGEMVSLGAIEALANQVWPEADHAAVAMADARRGERTVLVTTRRPASKSALISGAKSLGASELLIPDSIIETDAIPRLGSGKTDYPGLNHMAVAARSNASV
ncbi:acyl-[acyl-carrier-protein]-phospholipid O-acyltransferase/long-chain-fatty-acid--[acyl-carrier-protein] ligase [Rhizobium sp. SG_E_25_P2]|uniref:AMP-binding protein n=1 Tax=Rhizobium sp. SG_E_25_P2 TaxID=2879942 RepID=UPI002476DE57|nr:AMP-binding protein [Rhizobium sp. SG_E_25_P2]MDH6266829.1 acyl-[acyl-carrier-protein]-phospholipid O-acyltransferase/long-chain-fatty-acid--[acyl-carrier-protein] ligase [Rhizobium sp. SG_E_25_P2]